MSTLLSPVDQLVCLEHELGERQVVDDGREGAADQRTDDRDPGVAPIGIPLAGDRQEEVGDPRTEVSGWVDRVPGRSTERQADDKDEERDWQGAERRQAFRR